MENTTNAQQVMGPGVPRPKVSTFNGQQPFPYWQQELFNSYVSTAPNPMDSKSLEMFQELQQQITYLEKEIKIFKPDKEFKNQSQVDAAEGIFKECACSGASYGKINCMAKRRSYLLCYCARSINRSCASCCTS